MTTRREFSRALAAAMAAGAAPFAAAQDQATPTLYFVDGYHGGIRGHMPAGAWRDILNTLRQVPEWKISFDIEPASWDELRRQDPAAYGEIRTLLEDQSADARVEMLNGTFGQPFGWAAGGESNIRQLQRGREVLLRHFPNLKLDTYAVQEPCWTSCLPQILLSLGFSYGVLKNPGTAWGGYAAGFDAETVDWTGPDGSKIPTAPRYACEELVRVHETESAYGTAEFSRKAAANGIAHPAGTYLQDLGWAARPRVSGDHLQYVTWREYMSRIAGESRPEWRFSQEDILVTLPWGEQTLQTVARQVRSAENLLLVAEKMAAMAAALRGTAFPHERLREAWDLTLWSQHHDAWITATTRSGRSAWAFQVAAETLEAEEICREIVASSAEALSRVTTPTSGPQWARVFNTVAAQRDDLVELNWAVDPGTLAARVFDAAGQEIPCQLVASRTYRPRGMAENRRRGDAPLGGVPEYAPGESLNAAAVLFRANVPGIGFASYRVEPVVDVDRSELPQGAAGEVQADGTVLLETDVYRVTLDPARGGVITSLYAKALDQEFVDGANERLFNEYRGYFISEEKWCSSADAPARITLAENGPVRVRAVISGRIEGRPFQTTISLVQGQRRIDFDARFTYPEDTWIGDPWDIQPENRMSERRRSSNDGRWKLQALFPVPFQNQTIHKNAAYDVCRSRNADTFFQGWDEIKHNIVLNWVDVADGDQSLGLAVLSDHTTAYTHGPEHPLALVMGWGWEGGFWWGKRPLRGAQQLAYSLVPHAGPWDEAGVWEENSRWSEPLIAQLMNGAPAEDEAQLAWVSSVSVGVEAPTVLIDGSDVLVRLFNASAGDGLHKLTIGGDPARAELVELDGRVIRELPISRKSERAEVSIEIPRFGIRTVRLAGLAPG